MKNTIDSSSKQHSLQGKTSQSVMIQNTSDKRRQI